jgi:hypothetical protein
MDWFATMATAYRQNKPEPFNRAVAEYRQWSAEISTELNKGRREFFYNDIRRSSTSIIIYVFCSSPRHFVAVVYPGAESPSRCGGRLSISYSGRAGSHLRFRLPHGLEGLL